MKNIYQAVSDPAETFYTEEKKLALEQAIQRLPGDQQIVINYYFFDNLSAKMIAQQLNCSEANVHTSIKKSLYTLRKQLNPSYYKKAMEILYGQLQNHISY